MAKASPTFALSPKCQSSATLPGTSREDLRRIGSDGIARFDHRRQRLDIEDDRLERVIGLRQGFSDDAGDGIADEAHLVGRQRRPRRLDHR